MRGLVVFLLFAALVAGHSSAQARRAFIAGVDAYDQLTVLTRPVEDARGYAQVFNQDLGFAVAPVLENPTRLQFSRAFGQFLESIRPGDEVVFVFSGHGWSDGAENYLVLRDAPRDASEFELKEQTVALSQTILAEIAARNPSLVVAIIDACRDNPFSTGTKSGYEKGLGRADVGDGMLVIYSAGERQRALERLGAHDREPYSLFTRKLLPALRNADMPLMLALDEAREQVATAAAAINHPQRPAFYSTLSMKFCFSGRCALPQGALKSSASDEQTLLDFALQSGMPAVLRAFAMRYPDSVHLTRVHAQIEALETPRPPDQTTSGSRPADVLKAEAFDLLNEVLGRPAAKPILFPATGLVKSQDARLSCRSADGDMRQPALKFGAGVRIVGRVGDALDFLVDHSQHGRCTIPANDVSIQSQ